MTPELKIAGLASYRNSALFFWYDALECPVTVRRDFVGFYAGV